MKLRLLSPAIQEISEAALWLDSQTTGLGEQFWRTVDQTLAQIEKSPLRFGKSDFSTSEIDLRYALVG